MNQAPVLVYFADDVTRTYQLLPWLPVLELLADEHPVAVVTRDPAATAVVEARTGLPVFSTPGFRELRDLYAALDPKVVLYCNNSMRNFDSLLEGRALHVHVGHGESDKQSMASNNAKSYDRVFVAGEAAVQRTLHGLLEFDPGRLVRIGRPQLDLPRTPPIPARPDRRTLLYAPTWEGDADYNNYTSLDVMGLDVVRELLRVPDARVVYKPHPQVGAGRSEGIDAAHRDVLRVIGEAVEADPGAGHAALPGADVLALMPVCDAMVTDVSSVGLDWLYLRTGAPLFLTDRHRDAERMHAEVPVSRCADVVAGPHGLGDLVDARLRHDEHHLARVAMRHHYFDDVQVGESTERLREELGALVALRDRLLAGDASLTA